MWWQDTIRETECKGGYLEEYPIFDWESVKLLEKRFNMFMSAFAKSDFCYMILNFWETVHLISGDVNEQRVAIVQYVQHAAIWRWYLRYAYICFCSFLFHTFFF